MRRPWLRTFSDGSSGPHAQTHTHTGRSCSDPNPTSARVYDRNRVPNEAPLIHRCVQERMCTRATRLTRRRYGQLHTARSGILGRCQELFNFLHLPCGGYGRFASELGKRMVRQRPLCVGWTEDAIKSFDPRGHRSGHVMPLRSLGRNQISYQKKEGFIFRFFS